MDRLPSGANDRSSKATTSMRTNLDLIPVSASQRFTALSTPGGFNNNLQHSQTLVGPFTARHAAGENQHIVNSQGLYTPVMGDALSRKATATTKSAAINLELRASNTLSKEKSGQALTPGGFNFLAEPLIEQQKLKQL